MALHFLALAKEWNRSAIVPAMAEGDGRSITDGGFFHARNRSVAAQNFAQQYGFLRGGAVNVGFGIVGIRQRGLDCHDPRGIEAELHLE